MKQGEQPPTEGTRQPKFNPSFCSIQPSNSPPSLSSFIKQSVVSSLMKKVHGSLQNVGGLGPWWSFGWWPWDTMLVVKHQHKFSSVFGGHLIQWNFSLAKGRAFWKAKCRLCPSALPQVATYFRNTPAPQALPYTYWNRDDEEPMKAGELSSHAVPQIGSSHPHPCAVTSQVCTPSCLYLPPYAAETSQAWRSVRISSHAASYCGKVFGSWQWNAIKRSSCQFVRCRVWPLCQLCCGEEWEQLQGEIDKLRLDLKLTLSDKTDMSLKYENLVAICHLQR